MDMKRFFLYAIVITALALAGCGGGGGGTSLMVGDERATQALIDALQDRADAANAANMTLGAIRTALDLEDDADQAAIEGAIMTLQNANPEDPVIAQLRTQLELGDDATPTAIMDAIDDLQAMAALAPPTVDPNPAATKAAGTKRMAIATEAGQGPGLTPTNDDAGIGGSADDGTAVDTYSLTIKRDRTKTTVTIADTALAGDDDPKFTQAMDLGGGTTMHVRTKEANEDGDVESEVVIVTTDIQAPRGRPFAMWQNAAGLPLQALNAEADGTQDDGTMFVAFDPNTAALARTTEADVPILDNIASPVFSPPAAGGQSRRHTFAQDTDSVMEGNQFAMVAGTYNGAMGTYACATTPTCTVDVNAMGKLTGFSDGWIFTPARGATSDQPDYDYLSYGFWLKRTTDSDGVLTYNEVETFANSSVAASGSVASVTGTATYEGDAVGVYVHSVTDNDGDEVLATSGHFTADAELKATFGQVPVSGTDTTGTIAPNLLNTLTGTIDNFRLSGHDDGPGWSVALDGDIDATAGTVASGTAKGGDGDGSFSATFHGSVTAATDGTVPKPGSVVGEFNAGFNNGSVAGAFGATKQ